MKMLYCHVRELKKDFENFLQIQNITCKIVNKLNKKSLDWNLVSFPSSSVSVKMFINSVIISII